MVLISTVVSSNSTNLRGFNTIYHYPTTLRLCGYLIHSFTHIINTKLMWFLYPPSLTNNTNVPTPITQPHQGCVTLIHTLFYLTTQRLCGSHTHSFVTQQHHVVWLSYPLSSPDNTNARCLSYPPLSPNNTNVVWLPFPLLSPDNTNARWLSYSFLLQTT